MRRMLLVVGMLTLAGCGAAGLRMEPLGGQGKFVSATANDVSVGGQVVSTGEEVVLVHGGLGVNPAGLVGAVTGVVTGTVTTTATTVRKAADAVLDR